MKLRRSIGIFILLVVGLLCHFGSSLAQTGNYVLSFSNSKVSSKVTFEANGELFLTIYNHSRDTVLVSRGEDMVVTIFSARRKPGIVSRIEVGFASGTLSAPNPDRFVDTIELMAIPPKSGKCIAYEIELALRKWKVNFAEFDLTYLSLDKYIDRNHL